MAEKRTKADKAQRQADQLEKKARHPAPRKKRKLCVPAKATGDSVRSFALAPRFFFPPRIEAPGRFSVFQVTRIIAQV